ncbi:FAD-dependent monooxygenase [Altererythrobacter lutimaris]|uniref:FAD-dependent monooxygenase n=1 Tax=Altererythrobacter lutimaris TaxID=2743979 RepID=A0A850H7F4_9SPHN|nr:FAD-dependent monooxygenase [Altererythrobacter lutimaris]NVE93480.1 FAD-dependent monooxygenase [Altererythrobacter lutimaris]
MKRVAIIGGGIGGLTAGIALLKAGLEPVIYERAPEFGEVGAGISLSPNAVKGLDSIGLGGFLESTANEPLHQLLFHGLTGELLLDIDRVPCRDQYGGPYLQLHRADLMNGLVDAFGTDNCVMGKALTGLSQDESHVEMRFDDGSTAEADVVIGVDGLRSVIRDILFDTPEPEFSGHVAWRALIPGQKLSACATERTNVNHIGAGQNLVTYPVRGTDLVNMVALTRADGWVEESWNAKAHPSELAAIFEGWTDYVTDAIAAIGKDDLYRWGLFIRTPLNQWVKGRVGLLGDAAHPMLPYMGQGASSAIEDGVVLGRCFATSSDPLQALAMYEKARVERAAFLQAESNVGGDRLQAMDPYVLRDNPPKNEDALGIFKYDPASVELA